MIITCPKQPGSCKKLSVSSLAPLQRGQYLRNATPTSMSRRNHCNLESWLHTYCTMPKSGIVSLGNPGQSNGEFVRVGNLSGPQRPGILSASTLLLWKGIYARPRARRFDVGSSLPRQGSRRYARRKQLLINSEPALILLCIIGQACSTDTSQAYTTRPDHTR